MYLSPHVNKELEYHPDDVYVLGGISKHKEPLSLKKAQFEGIRCARFPVGYQQWVRGSRILSIYELSTNITSVEYIGPYKCLENIKFVFICCLSPISL